MSNAAIELDTNTNAMQRLRAELAQSPPLIWALVYFFCLLCGYYVLRPVRDAMGATGDITTIFPPSVLAFATARGVDLADYSLQVLFSLTFIVMLVLQPLYGWLVSRWPRRVFLPLVYGLFIACLIGFWWAFNQKVSGRGFVFFVWVGIFNLFAVTVFWSYMADVFDNADAKRVYGYIGAGGTIGALTGPLITRQLVGVLGVGNLLLVSAGFLLLCLLCIVMLRPYAQAREVREHGKADGKAMGGSIWAGFKLVAADPLLRALALIMFFGVGVGTLLYNEQAAIVRAAYANDEARAEFYSSLDLAINVLTLVVQVFITRWLLRRHGVAPALLIPACAILLGYCLLAASPMPILVALVQVATRAGEFSLAKPARETIYTRVDRQSRYKAKAFIDTAVYRFGDVSWAWTHKLLTLFSTKLVYVAGIGVAAGLLFSAWLTVREQRRLPERSPPAHDAP